MEKITIGDNSIIGLGAIVFRDVKENTVVIGNPAKGIKNAN
jgi:acetyltransferase-like isoleucine patch superfamily enzyme